jgi:decaprenylphospho-beta-D-erythro-pentofuranosid-2-ulose 2-reductase
VRDALGSIGSLLVLGAGSDIAQATARALVDEHTRVVLLAARRPERLGAHAAVLRAAGAERVETLAFDAERADTHEQLVGAAVDRLGDIDLVLVAFGVLPDQVRAEHDTGLALRAARVNFLGALSVLTPLSLHLRRQGHGTIVVLSSVAAERPRRSNYVYGATKAGLDAYAQGLSDALADAGVHVMVVRPGFVHTKMTAGLKAAPLATTPERTAEAIVAGLARGAHTVWAPPGLRPAMSALRHLPRPIFRRLDL